MSLQDVRHDYMVQGVGRRWWSICRNPNPDEIAVGDAEDSVGEEEEDVVEERMRRLADAVQKLIDRVQTAAMPVTLQFVFMIQAGYDTTNAPRLIYDHFVAQEHDITNMHQIEFKSNRFWWEQRCHDQYISDIEVLHEYPQRACVQVCIKIRNDKEQLTTEHVGFMRFHEYKKLFIFVISQSGNDAILHPKIPTNRADPH